jgi:hypothetical protein
VSSSSTASEENCITTTKKNIDGVVDAVDSFDFRCVDRKDLSAQANKKGWRERGTQLRTRFFAIIDEITPGDGQYG